MAAFVGAPGYGKSWAALAEAERIDPTFNIDRVAFSNPEFIHIIKNEDVPKGGVIIYEEVGVELGHLDFMSSANKAVNFVLQTFRYKNYVVFFTTPSLNLVSKNSRQLFHVIFNMEKKKDKIERKTYSRGRVMYLETNPVTGKIYTKRFVNYAGDYLYPKRFPKPSPGLLKKYQAKKDAYSAKLYAIQEGQALEKSPFGDLTDLQREVYEDYTVHKLKQREIADKRGQTQGNVSAILKVCRKKGYI
jgi:hypothetical protein